MSNPFLTVEDINGAIRCYGTGVYYFEIDTSKISSTSDFSGVKYDFCKVWRSTDGSNITYTIRVDNPYWCGAYYLLKSNRDYIDETLTNEGREYIFSTDSEASVIIGLVIQPTRTFNLEKINTILTGSNTVNVPFSYIGHGDSVRLPAYNLSSKTVTGFDLPLTNTGLVEITDSYINGFVLLDKSNFLFECTQDLKLGQINHVALGTVSMYKPNGSEIGTYTPTIKILYNGETITAEYDTDDYYFDLDLTDVTEPSKVKFKVIIETNEVLNHTETEVTLNADYGLISTLTELTNLCTNGGIGKINAIISLTSDLTVAKDTILIADDDKGISFDDSSLIVSNNTLLKMEGVILGGGANTIQQKKGSRVELTDCLFSDCFGFGSCIKCDIDQDSLEAPDDYTTILTGCSFSNNEGCAILHGGNLTVTDCSYSNDNMGGSLQPNAPAFLYQTDGEANITGSTFDITVNDTINSDLMFGPALFMIGETAVINGRNHDEWRNNNQTGFLGLPYNNQSQINLTYLYDLISANVTVSSSNGYCHAVSGEDYLFKTNITLTRSE